MKGDRNERLKPGPMISYASLRSSRRMALYVVTSQGGRQGGVM